MNDITIPKGNHPTPLAVSTAFQELADAVSKLLREPLPSPPSHGVITSTDSTTSLRKEILLDVQKLVTALMPEKPIFASFHDGMVHDPLGSGAYAFQGGLIQPLVEALVRDEVMVACQKSSSVNKEVNGSSRLHPLPEDTFSNKMPTQPIVIHVGAQPNNSPHLGTLVVFCYAFWLARKLSDHMHSVTSQSPNKPPDILVELDLVDTAPVSQLSREIDGIQYQRSLRDVPDILSRYVQDYYEVMGLLSSWADIPFTVRYQQDLFSHHTMPQVVHHLVKHHSVLGRQLSPQYGALGLRAACPVPECCLSEKHGQLNKYKYNDQMQSSTNSYEAEIVFHCPLHGPHTINTCDSAQLSRLEANAPARNLIRSMSHLLDVGTHHVRVTGSDYAGTYQEVFLYRPLAAWSTLTGLSAGRIPHILYAPLIVDWSGAKLSKSLYVQDGAYDSMKLLGGYGFISYQELKKKHEGTSYETFKKLWREVEKWFAEPKKLFRMYSIEYLLLVLQESGDNSTQ
ncbi:hypothetical protein FMUND_9250 [Fusarium mundagurra]|uniref:Uncharacterized protein n=1 Tax=Fusarium mundagurra TaxID=1567541 RepID=A0A8H5YF20_9HYPO|nr:hypothetical protein FMUND_9250 [Fusarium mundagurra]